MIKEDKNQAIASLTKDLNENSNFYITDISGFSAEKTSNLRRSFFNSKISLKVVKNTLLIKAMENAEKDYSEIYGALKGSTAISFTEVGNAPAKLITDLRKKSKTDKPYLKAAFVEDCTYLGDNNLELLVTIKSKNELIGELIGLLQSPAKNVISGLQSGGQKLSGIVKILSER